MLLETLDIKKNDIVIYSQNIFNIDRNFSIIFKDDPTKVAKSIDYNEVCSYINEYTPKNLIVYRLLTNSKEFGLRVSKYGFFIFINDVSELIYFDPIFAIKELEEYAETLNLYDIRFRIQQVGLTTLNRKGDLPNYAEIYSVDLEATEAKFQNDKVFADAIFAFDEIVKTDDVNRKGSDFDNEKIPPKQYVKPQRHKIENKLEEKVRQKENKKTISRDGFKIIHHDIAEDQDFDYKEIMKINIKHGYRTDEKRKSKTFPSSEIKPNTNSSQLVPKLVKQGHKEQSSFRKFLENSQANKKSKESKTPTDEKNSQVIDILKSSSPLNNFASGREEKQVVLKLNKNKKPKDRF